MSSLVTDTHALIWYMLSSEKLSPKALAAFDQATTNGSFIYLSAISIVEIVYLVEKGRLPTLVLQRLTEAIHNTNMNVTVVPLDVEISLAIRQFTRASVPDMPDRIIAATALHLNLPLITHDGKLLALTAIKTIW